MFNWSDVKSKRCQTSAALANNCRIGTARLLRGLRLFVAVSFGRWRVVVSCLVSGADRFDKCSYDGDKTLYCTYQRTLEWTWSLAASAASLSQPANSTVSKIVAVCHMAQLLAWLATYKGVFKEGTRRAMPPMGHWPQMVTTDGNKMNQNVAFQGRKFHETL